MVILKILIGMSKKKKNNKNANKNIPFYVWRAQSIAVESINKIVLVKNKGL